MNIIPHIFIPCTIGLIIFVAAFFKYPRWAIAGMIIVKPIIDLTWEYNVVSDINYLKIYAGIFAVLGIAYIIYHRTKIAQSPVNLIWLIFLVLSFISIFVISYDTPLLDKVDYFLRVLSGFVVLIFFAFLFSYEKDKKFVLSIFIIAGISPMVFWLINVLSGNPVVSNDELMRIIGPYHRFWQFNFYAMQTIFCSLAYLAITNKSRAKTENTDKYNDKVQGIHREHRLSKFSLINVGLLLMIVIGIGMVYTCYSKAGWIALFVCFFLWFILRKKLWQTILVPIAAAVFIFVNPFRADFQTTFQNEIDYFFYNADTKESVFRGRLVRWEVGMVDFNDLPVLNKLLGAEKLIGHPENYYLRVLWDTGIIGLIIYIALLCLTGFLLIRAYVKNKDPVVLTGILIFVFYVFNSIGSYPMFNPAFQWLMWGTVGFILSERYDDSAE